jgi:hypothetical protein
VSPNPADNRNDGVPRATVRLATLPGKKPIEEQWAGANQAKDEKLRVRKLERRARDGGYELRHSDRGWALMDAARKPVDDRRGLSLKDVASLLDEALKT